MSLSFLDATGTDRDRFARLALNLLFEPGHPFLDAHLPGHTPNDFLTALIQGRGPNELRAAWVDIQPRLESLDPVRTLELADKLGIRFVTPADAEWPSQVEELAGQPPVQDRTGVPIGLWIRGPLSLATLDSSVAVVGSRDATSYGTEATGRIAGGIAGTLTVVSGAAYGIDAAAHRAALAVGAPTVAVLACGADRVYPTSHESLLAGVAATGAIVSELAPGERVTRQRFLGRNRLIAALTRGTVLVEAALRSGALNTAGWTAALNRQLMCVPGPITSITSVGVLEAVRKGQGVIVTRPEEVLELVSPAGEGMLPERTSPQTVRDRLTYTQRQVLDAVPLRRPHTATEIACDAGVGYHVVARAMLHLERQGLVQRGEGGWRLAPQEAAS